MFKLYQAAIQLYAVVNR